MRQKVQEIAGSKDVRNNLMLMVGGVIVSGLNYLFIPIVARFVGPASLGEIQFVLLVVTLTATIASIFRIVLVYGVSNNDHKIVGGVWNLFKKLSFLTLVLLLILSPFIKQLFKLENIASSLIIAPMAFVAYYKVFYDNFFKARGDFKKTLTADILYSSSKIALFLIGYWLLGPQYVVILILFALMLSVYYLFKIFNKQKFSLINAPIISTLKARKVLLVNSFVVSVFVFMINADILVAKASLDPELAGYYGSVSVLANGILFATGSLATVMMASGKKITKKQFMFSQLVTAVLAFMMLLFFSIYSQEIVRIAFGKSFLVYADLLPVIGLSMAFIAVSNVTISYLSIHNFRHLYKYLLVYIGLLVALLATNHASGAEIARFYTISNTLGFFITTLGLVHYKYGR